MPHVTLKAAKKFLGNWFKEEFKFAILCLFLSICNYKAN
jgi:ABC-type arginine/histidine transport system permease subunit